MDERKKLTLQAIQEGPEVYYRHYMGMDPKLDSPFALGTMIRYSATTILDLCGAIFADTKVLTVNDVKMHPELMNKLRHLNNDVAIVLNHEHMKKMRELQVPVEPVVMYQYGLCMGTLVEAFLTDELRDLHSYLQMEGIPHRIPSAKHIPLQLDTYDRYKELISKIVQDFDEGKEEEDG